MGKADKSGTRVLALRLRVVSAVCTKSTTVCTSSIGSCGEMLLTTGRPSAVRCALDPRPGPAEGTGRAFPRWLSASSYRRGAILLTDSTQAAYWLIGDELDDVSLFGCVTVPGEVAHTAALWNG